MRADTRNRPRRRLGLATVVMALTLLAIGACGGGGDERGSDSDDSSSPTTESPTTSTQPPGTDAAAVEPIVADLLGRLDVVSTEIIGDPGAVINDPNSPALAELEEIFAPGDAYDARLDTYRQNAEAGIKVVPVNASQVTTTAVVGDLTTIDADSAEGFLCILNTYRSSGSPSGEELKDHVPNPGRVTAVRIDGVWKIQQVDIDDTQICDWEEAST